MKALNEDSKFKMIHLYGNELVIHQLANSNRQTIVVPHQLQYPAVRWLHSILGHAGINRLYETLSSHFWFPQMKELITYHIKGCKFCQKYKPLNRQYGHLPPKNVQHLEP